MSNASVVLSAGAGAGVGAVVGGLIGGPVGAAVGAVLCATASSGASVYYGGAGYGLANLYRKRHEQPYRLFEYIRENAQSDEVRRAFGGKPHDV